MTSTLATKATCVPGAERQRKWARTEGLGRVVEETSKSECCEESRQRR